MTRSWALLPFPTPKDQVGGHEGVGEVVKLGPGAETSGLSLGSRVGVKWLASVCGECGTSPPVSHPSGNSFNNIPHLFLTPPC